jgi:cytochrome P450
MTDVTVIATTAITGTVAVLTAGIGYLAGARQAHAEDARQRLEFTTRRRDERRDAYQAMADLLTDFGWSGEDYDVVEQFNKPFLRAANRVRLYGSPGARAAVDQIQEALQLAKDPEAGERANEAFYEAVDALFTAAREDVGPRPEDGLAPASFLPGVGPHG